MSKDNIVKECNCRGGSKKCPLGGFCQEEEIVYKAEVKTDDKSHSYIGLTATTFKERYANHTSSFNNISKQYSTNLSKYIGDFFKSILLMIILSRKGVFIFNPIFNLNQNSQIVSSNLRIPVFKRIQFNHIAAEDFTLHET